jgi:uncharacterized protein (DUF2336 family)
VEAVVQELKQKLAEAARRQLTREEVLRILEERTQAAQYELAQQTDVGDDVLGYLAAHGGTATRRAVAINCAAPARANQLLSEDEDDVVRAELGRKIARLMPDLAQQEALELRAHAIQLIEKLAQDQAPRVRAILAEEIKQLDCVPKSVIEVLARDVEEIVSAPILEYSPLLSDADLIEIIADAKAECALSAIARRRPLAAPVSDAVVATLDVSAVATLLANPKAEIRHQTLEKLVETARDIAAWHEPLVLRSDLSARTIRRLASFVGSALLETLTRRNGLDEETQLLLDRRLRVRLQQFDRVPTARAMHTIELALQNGCLNGEFIEIAAKGGNKEAVIMALAALAKAPPETVRRIIEARAAKAVAALVWKAGLSMRVAVAIQSFVMKLKVEERLAARGGWDFPLSREEMCWQLDYFGLDTAKATPLSEM